MNLSDELFQQIADSIAITGEYAEAAKAPTVANDARTSPRVRAARHITGYGWDDLTDLGSVRVRDLAPGGLCIFHADRLPLDQQVVVRLPMGQVDSALMLCSVVYWEPLSVNLCAVGLQFDRQITEQELSARQRDLLEATELTTSHRSAARVLGRMAHALSRRIAG